MIKEECPLERDDLKKFGHFSSYFPQKIIGFDLNFEQLTKGCNLRDERYALKSGIFISFLSAL